MIARGDRCILVFTDLSYPPVSQRRAIKRMTRSLFALLPRKGADGDRAREELTPSKKLGGDRGKLGLVCPSTVGANSRDEQLESSAFVENILPTSRRESRT